MSSSSDYRARAEDVRRAARERLAELRAERLSRKRYGARSAAEPLQEPPEESLLAEEIVELSAVLPAQAMMESSLSFRASSAAAKFAARAATSARAQFATEAAPILAPEAALLEPKESAPETPPGGEAAASPDAPSDEPAADGEGLESLPGIGPGLVWVLRQRGLASLADLARSDGADLRDALGLLGAFVDVDSWIAHARRAAAS